MTNDSTIDPALLEPPDDATVARALQDFAKAVRRHYGDRLCGIYLFGSRARGDHTPDSDADVAVVLQDDGWKYWDEKMTLADLSYDPLVETGAEIQGWPLRESEWVQPDCHRNPSLVRSMRKDARPL